MKLNKEYNEPISIRKTTSTSMRNSQAEILMIKSMSQLRGIIDSSSCLITNQSNYADGLPKD